MGGPCRRRIQSVALYFPNLFEAPFLHRCGLVDRLCLSCGRRVQIEHESVAGDWTRVNRDAALVVTSSLRAQDFFYREVTSRSQG